ncbi:MAG: hypothetical protein CVU39_25010 [Chloroflexi bacterium HGW-Chloroflexi-10]|nr:MAG: hypothetical protein CVU39_25010 [Chloroflexi bacterium HGW-Chloroflexi-10]
MDDKCQGFIYADISIFEPIILNQRTGVTINIQPFKDQPRLVVGLITNPNGNLEFTPPELAEKCS